MSIRGYSFVFALMKCSNAAFGEQNKIDNDSKCQLVYKSPKKVIFLQKICIYHRNIVTLQKIV